MDTWLHTELGTFDRRVYVDFRRTKDIKKEEKERVMLVIKEEEEQ